MCTVHLLLLGVAKPKTGAISTTEIVAKVPHDYYMYSRNAYVVCSQCSKCALVSSTLTIFFLLRIVAVENVFFPGLLWYKSYSHPSSRFYQRFCHFYTHFFILLLILFQQYNKKVATCRYCGHKSNIYNSNAPFYLRTPFCGSIVWAATSYHLGKLIRYTTRSIWKLRTR